VPAKLEPWVKVDASKLGSPSAGQRSPYAPTASSIMHWGGGALGSIDAPATQVPDTEPLNAVRVTCSYSTEAAAHLGVILAVTLCMSGCQQRVWVVVTVWPRALLRCLPRRRRRRRRARWARRRCARTPAGGALPPSPRRGRPHRRRRRRRCCRRRQAGAGGASKGAAHVARSTPCGVRPASSVAAVEMCARGEIRAQHAWWRWLCNARVSAGAAEDAARAARLEARGREKRLNRQQFSPRQIRLAAEAEAVAAEQRGEGSLGGHLAGEQAISPRGPVPSLGHSRVGG
jgi:hypothetical protein